MPYADPEKRSAYHKSYMRDRYANDEDFKRAHLQRVAKNKKERIAVLQGVFKEFKKNGCLLCAEKEPCCLIAHHLEPEHKKFTLSEGIRSTVSLSSFLRELEKCVCLCENCHRKAHAGVLEVSRGDLMERTGVS
jgi:hypothetical protein